MVNAFCIDWRNHTFYVFLPFSLISPSIQKISRDKVKGKFDLSAEVTEIFMKS